MKKETTREKIVELSQKWYEFVGKDHHKDNDCHWYIDTDFAYGEEPIFTACHYGYIADELKSASRATYEEAEDDLLKLLKKAIEKELRWIDGVIANPKDYDEIQVKQAELFKKLFNS